MRIPPFPGHRAGPLCARAVGQSPANDDAAHDDATSNDPAALIAALAAARVGGSFWAAQPSLPAGRDVLLVPDTQAQAATMLDQAIADGLADRVMMIGPYATRGRAPAIASLCDPWHLAGLAEEIRAGAGQELALVAAVLGKPLTVLGAGRFAGIDDAAQLHRCVLREMPGGLACRDPFTHAAIPAAQAIALLADWRGLIDANRQAAAIFGIAMWKRVTMDALLWAGSGPPPHAAAHGRHAAALVAGQRVLAWKSRSDGAGLAALEARGVAVGEIEDGMIRSTGLGANCVPPLSVIVDFQGAHFDPAQASGLEMILSDAEIPAPLLARAAALRQRLVAAGISKYGQDNRQLARPDTCQRRVLVTGQVEDDRSVLSGGAGCTNLELVRQARSREPGAWLIYKPHPDVEAGHRKGFVPDAEVLRHADQIERDAPITALIDSVDALHVITSLAGFEALMRGKAVTTHGVPFYAGWGLTHDLGPVPERRGRKRSLDELVAATLLLYPRYLDPVTRLPCPAEVLVERMAQGQAVVSSPLVRLREWQGRLNLAISRFKGGSR